MLGLYGEYHYRNIRRMQLCLKQENRLVWGVAMLKYRLPLRLRCLSCSSPVRRVGHDETRLKSFTVQKGAWHSANTDVTRRRDARRRSCQGKRKQTNNGAGASHLPICRQRDALSGTLCCLFRERVASRSEKGAMRGLDLAGGLT